MCNEAVDNYTRALEFVLDCFKTRTKCTKAVNTSPSAIQFVRQCYKTQETCVKAIDACRFIFDSVPLIDTRLKNWVIKLFLMILFML